MVLSGVEWSEEQDLDGLHKLPCFTPVLHPLQQEWQSPHTPACTLYRVMSLFSLFNLCLCVCCVCRAGGLMGEREVMPKEVATVPRSSRWTRTICRLER